MTRHVDTTANVQRTTEETLRVTHNIDDVNAVVDGYPPLDGRLYVPETELPPYWNRRIFGVEVRIFDIPGGHDAMQTPARAQTLASMRPEDFLYGDPDPDLPTGGAGTCLMIILLW